MEGISSTFVKESHLSFFPLFCVSLSVLLQETRHFSFIEPEQIPFSQSCPLAVTLCLSLNTLQLWSETQTPLQSIQM